ncbi:hypothetical protein SteCoe_33740 [Stentor coeruleus]|uniref:Uncharacterized protein n=1 Tax=Stentor coeruleus TaxID=5963 RepID=A0A1R2AW14_9CILI|nr:hypothetical protein SteCoe_33740 [Stentor coeruleus]
MSNIETNLSTQTQKSLFEAKKERQQCEQDLILLTNRIKLLQLEEEKSRKQIEESKKKHFLLEKAQQRSIEKTKFKEELQNSFEKQRKIKQKWIQDLKLQITKNKESSLKNVEKAKKKAYIEMRSQRDQSLIEKYKILNDTVKKNKERSLSVREDHMKFSMKAKRLEKIRESQNKSEYIKRLNDEIYVKTRLESKVSEMETLESELIKRIQNTQNVQFKVFSDLHNLKRKPLSP